MATTADIKLVHWTRDVYEPSDDSFLLVDALQARLLQPQPSTTATPGRASGTTATSSSSTNNWPRVALEIGCGSGYVITSLALLLRSRRRPPSDEEDKGTTLPPSSQLLLATDVSAPALSSTAETLAAHGLRAGADVELVQGDLAEPLRARLRGAVDLLVRV
jgi:release factor glutamine methyltransferase